MDLLGAQLASARSSGSPDGTAVVFLHPMGVDQECWAAVTSLLPGYRILTYDFPGHGRCPAPDEEYAVTTLADHLAQLLDSLNVAAPHVVGMSLGGMVAQHFAARYPQAVAKLVLASCVAVYPEAAAERFRTRAATVRAHGMSAIVHAQLGSWFSDAAMAADVPAVRYARSAFTTTSPEGYARACLALAAADVRAGLPRIAAPTLVVRGSDEPSGIGDGAREISEIIPRASLHTFDGRHAVVLERHAEFARLLSEFFGG